MQLYSCLFLTCTKQVRELPVVCFIKALISLMFSPPYWLNQSIKASSPNTITIGVKTRTQTFTSLQSTMKKNKILLRILPESSGTINGPLQLSTLKTINHNNYLQRCECGWRKQKGQYGDLWLTIKRAMTILQPKQASKRNSFQKSEKRLHWS
jgi:hypothetical protein